MKDFLQYTALALYFYFSIQSRCWIDLLIILYFITRRIFQDSYINNYESIFVLNKWNFIIDGKMGMVDNAVKNC